MERPELPLHELQDLQKRHIQQMQDGQQYEEGGLAASEEAERAPNPGGERGLRDFNYNGRVRNGERASERASSGVLVGQHQPHRNSASIYSNYSSYAPSLDGGGGHERHGGGVEDSDCSGGGGGDGGNSSGFGRGVPPSRPSRSPPPPPLPHIDQPRRQLLMKVPPAPGTADTTNTMGTEASTAVAGTESVQKVRQPPPPTYVPFQDHYNRVRFVDEEHGRQGEGEEADRGRSTPPIDKAHIKGAPNTRVLWVFACCAFFCYRCFMDEDF
ncbi:hypothetical protein CGRA01v4_02799 [Colletotrichum graminicola]|nr:hypothetical protein CGRA01v4_02799 [Colletotrichum graminicola]